MVFSLPPDFVQIIFMRVQPIVLAGDCLFVA